MSDKRRFRAGKYIQQPEGYSAFQPQKLLPPPQIELDMELFALSAKATASLGKLSGLASQIPDQDIFVYQYVRKEALLSSQIEGTQCSLEDVLSPESETITEDVEEVSNYVKAMNDGLARLSELPVCTRLIKEMHLTLLQGVRGHSKTPGEFRITQNWIGKTGADLKKAEFVPPPPGTVNELMGDLENYVHTTENTPPLIRAAIVHAQFETIHPFLDGNGRLGRLLITYLLCYWSVLDKPLLYLSYYFKAHRTEYYQKLMDVRLKGDWEGWIKFFLKGVAESAEMAIDSAKEINDLHKRDTARVNSSKQATAYCNKVFSEFCRYPILTNAALMTAHKTNSPKIQRAIDRLVNLGIVREISGKQRNRRYAYDEYMKILTRDTQLKPG